MKKFFSLVLALVMALSLTTVAWGADTWPSGTTVEGVTTVELTTDLTLDAPVVIAANTVINGNGHTLTYTGTDRAITVNDSGYDLTINDLTIVATTANRGVNYNTNGKLTLNNVNVTAATAADGYALNMPGSSDNAVVEINNSVLVGRIALNIWGTDATITVNNSSLSSIEDNDQFAYSAIQLNCEVVGGVMGNSADGTVVTVNGGDINGNGSPAVSISNWTSTGKVNISGTTSVDGDIVQYVAIIGGVGFTSVEDANEWAEEKGSTAITVLPAASAQGSFTPLAGVTYKDLTGATLTPAADGTIAPPVAGFTAGKYDLYDANGDLIADDVFAEAFDAAYNTKTSTGNVEYYELTVNGVAQKYYVECAKPDADVYLSLSNSTSAIIYLEKVPFVNYTVAKAYSNIGTACGQLPGNDAKYDYFTYSDADGVPYYFVETATGATEALMVAGELVFVKSAGTTVPHTWEVLTVNAKHEVTELVCDDCDAVATVYPTKLAAPKGAVKYAPYGWIAVNAPAASAPSTDKVQSAETFDAGIAMYVGMSVMAAAGSVVVLKKRED